MKANSYDVIVVGDGIAGLSTAIHLSKRGKKVALIRKRGVKGAASPAATGILDPCLESEKRSPLLKLAVQAFNKYPGFVKELERATKTKVDFEQLGLLYLAMNQKELVRLKQSYAWQAKAGVQVKFLSTQEVLKQEPRVDPVVKAGLYYPTSGRVKPESLLAALKRLSQKLGVKEITSSSKARLIVESKAVCGLQLGRRKLTAGTVVNATGAWADSVFPASRTKVIPARGQLFLGKSSSLKVKHILHTPSGDYLVPWGRETYVFGATVEKVGFKPTTNKQALEKITKRVERMVPHVSGVKRIRSWAGLRPLAPNKEPVVGPTSVAGLYVNTGFFKSGILIGYETGRLLADWIVQGKAPKLIEEFAPRG